MVTPRDLPTKTNRDGSTSVDWKRVRLEQAADEARRAAEGTRIEDMSFGRGAT